MSCEGQMMVRWSDEGQISKAFELDIGERETCFICSQFSCYSLKYIVLIQLVVDPEKHKTHYTLWPENGPKRTKKETRKGYCHAANRELCHIILVQTQVYRLQVQVY